MSINAKVSVRIKFCNLKQLTAAVAALEPEINSPVTHRAKVDLHVHECFLILTVDAEDTVALRATVNAYLHWIASTVNVVEVIERM
jgi:tRNA threonylcarbamoyladenosine modification (KEOPS) complex  Pcc1 subunit